MCARELTVGVSWGRGAVVDASAARLGMPPLPRDHVLHQPVLQRALLRVERLFGGRLLLLEVGVDLLEREQALLLGLTQPIRGDLRQPLLLARRSRVGPSPGLLELLLVRLLERLLLTHRGLHRTSAHGANVASHWCGSRASVATVRARGTHGRRKSVSDLVSLPKAGLNPRVKRYPHTHRSPRQASLKSAAAQCLGNPPLDALRWENAR
eukprot:2451333-Prymnesium_polylepis.1